MKHVALMLVFVLMLTMGQGILASAEIAVVEDITEPETSGEIGINPTSRFWFLQNMWENVQYHLTFRTEKKAQHLITQLERREAEMAMLRERCESGEASPRDVKALERVQTAYERRMQNAHKHMEQLEAKDQIQADKFQQRLERMEEQRQHLLEVLEANLEKNPNAPGLSRALENAREYKPKGPENNRGKGKGK